MGAQNSDCQIMGAAHNFFFLKRPFSPFLFYGRSAHNAPIGFFFLRRPFSQKKIMGKNIELYKGNSISFHSILFWDPNLNKKNKYGSGAHNAPIIFFYFFRPFCPKKNYGRCAHNAPMRFFFPPITLISLAFVEIWFFPLSRRRGEVNGGGKSVRFCRYII